MLRWTLIAVGVVVLAVGLRARSKEAARGALPRPVEPAAAREMALRREGAFVRVDSELDRGRRLWETGLAAPRYTSCSPGAVHPVQAVLDDVAAGAVGGGPERGAGWLGCRVEVRGLVSDRALDLDAAGRPDARSSGRLLAPVAGTEHRVWALSPPLPRRERAERLAWLRAPRHVGPLARFEALDRAVPGLADRPAAIARAWQRAYGEEGPGAGWVAVGAAALPEGRVAGRDPACLVPFGGSGLGLFVRCPAGEAARAGPPPIAGVVRPARPAERRGLAAILDAPLPERVALLEPVDPAVWRAARPSPDRWLVPGGVLIAAGLGLVALRAVLRRRERSAVRVDVEEELARRRGAPAGG